MLKKSTLIIAGVSMVAWATYVIWSNKNRHIALPPADVQYRSFAEVGRDSGRGNLIGIQPYMLAVDYSSEEAFFQKLNGYFAEARRKGWLNRKSIVILPENIGLWLVVAGEKREVYTTSRLDEAMKTLKYSNYFSFLSSRMQAPPGIKDQASYALLSMKAMDMATIYQQTFSHLASTYDVTIVAGTIPLPEPSIREEKLMFEEQGSLYNVSGVFLPDGSLGGLVRKTHLSETERKFITPGKITDLSVTETPAGNLAVLINQDSWFSEAYTTIRGKKPAIVAVPAIITMNNFFRVPWSGYKEYLTPADARDDVSKITEEEAWQKYSFVGRANKEANIKSGMGVFLHGELWNLGSDGETLMVQDTTFYEGKNTQGASLSCLWL
ncbi:MULTISPECIES: nitrilase-related carbon-nitrogen hydrolase [unclassified Siphonobacter]|nr:MULTISPECIES: nitrilase-related carbon-nitrogen hydrolase [unclassified Siphonobacter]MDQ1086933.1 hypothetical protein [Siphonobacter sp. SORGH_AS_1065]MDR6193043.1 hypothetical protein [Siphonobacter sp. SORGH_AS_0500]